MKLREWREERGLTRKHLADMLGVTVQAVYAWETGLSQPTRNINEIMQSTSGQVTANDFLKIPKIKKR